MQRFKTPPQTTEPAPAIAETECATAPTETVSSPAAAGQRLSDAQTADREWRGALALRLHRRLGKLRKSDALIQRGGVGVSGLMLLAALTMPVWARGAEWNENAFIMVLILGAFACAVGSLGVIAGIGWCHDQTRNWMKRLGMTEEWETATREAEPPEGAPNKAWICAGCRARNSAGAGACSRCARIKQGEVSQLDARIVEIESSMVNAAGKALGGLGLLLLVGLLLLAFRGFR